MRRRRKPHVPRGKRTVDLHGMTTDDAERKVLDVINRAVLDGMEKVSFVHGHGTGKVRDTVHRVLQQIPLTLTFKINDHNAGVTDVYL
jgi:DNA mismatch repair protein MutS2